MTSESVHFHLKNKISRKLWMNNYARVFGQVNLIIEVLNLHTKNLRICCYCDYSLLNHHCVKLYPISLQCLVAVIDPGSYVYLILAECQMGIDLQTWLS